MIIYEFINKAMNNNLIGKKVKFQHVDFIVEGTVERLKCIYTNNTIYLDLFIDAGPCGNTGYYRLDSTKDAIDIIE